MAQCGLHRHALGQANGARGIEHPVDRAEESATEEPPFIALQETRDRIKAVEQGTEEVWSEIMEKQGRLPFMEDQAGAYDKAQSNGKRKKSRQQPGARA